MTTKKRSKTKNRTDRKQRTRKTTAHPNTTVFRRLALALPGAIESTHMSHPDFRVAVPGTRGKIFATLGYPDGDHGMVRLSPEDQRQICAEHPEMFTPVKGKWGAQGATSVQLTNIDEETLGWALTQAWRRARG